MKKNFILQIFLILSFIFVCSTNVFCRGWVNDGVDWTYLDGNNNMVTEEIQSSGENQYYLDGEGYMVRDYLLEDYNGHTYYFNDEGVMVKNTWVAVDPYQVVNGMDVLPSIYLYYFGANGKAYKAGEGTGYVRKTIDGKKYLFNENGQMLSGWISEDGEMFNEFETTDDPFIGNVYYAGDETDGELREGWLAFEDGSTDDRYYNKAVIWFYFSPNNNKKFTGDEGQAYSTKKINGKTYAFDENGAMLLGWEADPANYYFKQDEDVEVEPYEDTDHEIGSMLKKEWVFTVPSELDIDDHDTDTGRWFYANGSGDIIKQSLTKINDKYYVFGNTGIMKTGLVVLTKSNKEYVDTIDIEYTDGKDFIISRYYMSADINKGMSTLFDDDQHVLFYFNNEDEDSDYGMRIKDKTTVAFADTDYNFFSDNYSQYEGLKRNAYYQAGVQLRADSNIGLGLVFVGYASTSNASMQNEEPEYNNSAHGYANIDSDHNDNRTDYIVSYNGSGDAYPVFYVVDANGKKVKTKNGYKKDKDGNYWMFGSNSQFIKVLNVPIKYTSGKWYYKSEETTATGGNRPTYLEMNTSETTNNGKADVYGRVASNFRNPDDEYEVKLTNEYALNFKWSD